MGIAEKKEVTSVTWFLAFKKVLFAEMNKGWSSLAGMILVTALFFPFVVLVDYYGYVTNFSGDIPPNVPIVKATGVFEYKIRKIGFREDGYVVFSADDGQHYEIKKYSGFKEQEKLIEEVPLRKMEVEGFFLRNGKGAFFPLYVKPIGGNVLLTYEQGLENLSRQRNVDYYVIGLYGVALFWLISFINIYRMKKKLSLEEKS
jgi:hypothetical protein